MTTSDVLQGRPPKYTDPLEFKRVADDYFNSTVAAEDVPTINGLCLALGITRETLCQYGNKPIFSDTVKQIKMRLEAWWEKRLAGSTPTGTIFWLKNQGWSDRIDNVVSNPDGSGLFSAIEVRLVRPSDT